MTDEIQSKNAVIYLRVSSEEQVENFSLGTQEEICRREATRRQFEIVEVFREEGKSAKTITGRPTLIMLLEFCRKNRGTIDAVFVYRVDRLSRQTADYLAIRKKLAEYGVTLISATEPTGNSPTEKLIETMLAGFAQMDNDVRSERSRNGMRARFLAGLCLAKPPLGYIMKNGYVIKDEVSFDQMKKAWNLVATGTKSMSEMAETMNKWGLRTFVYGKEHKLRAQTVDRIFRHKFYMGIITSPKYKEEVKGQHIPIVTEEQFYKVQSIIDGRNRCGMTIGKRLKNNPDFPLRGTIKCGQCGGNLSGAWSKGRSKKYAYYICKNRCGAPSIKVQVLNDSLVEFLRSITPPKEKLELFLMLLKRDFNKSYSSLMVKRENAESEIIQQKNKRQIVVDKNIDGTYTDDVYQEQIKVISDRISVAEIVLGKTVFDKYKYEDVEKFMKEKFKDLGKTYIKSEPGERKVLIGSICPTGLAWRYSGLSNQQFSPQYQAILDVREDDFASSTPEGNRTPNPFVRSEVLYPLSYRRLYLHIIVYLIRFCGVGAASSTG